MDFIIYSPWQIATVSLILFPLLSFLLYKLLRPYFHVTVTCWFCGHTTRVPYGNYNCFDCPECEQYNGFTKDGGYNKPIPAQHTSELNHSVQATKHDTFNSGSDALCASCQRNQLLKIRQLANFQPYSEANFDQEVESYRGYLEDLYQLCVGCRLRVSRHIAMQDRRLAPQIERAMRTPPRTPEPCQDHVVCRHSSPWHIYLLQLAALLAACPLCLSSVVHLLRDTALHVDLASYLGAWGLSYLEAVYHSAMLSVVTGLICTSAACIAVYMCRNYSVRLSDTLAVLTWLACLVVYSGHMKPLPPSDRYFIQAWLSLLALVMACYVTLAQRLNITKNTYIFRKSLSPARSVVRSGDGSPEVTYSVRTTPEHLPTQPTPSPPHRQGNNPFNEFETLSIGNKRGQMTGLAVNGRGPQPPSLDSLRYRGPLISPARFQPGSHSTQHAASSSTMHASPAPTNRPIYSTTHQHPRTPTTEQRSQHTEYSSQQRSQSFGQRAEPIAQRMEVFDSEDEMEEESENMEETEEHCHVKPRGRVRGCVWLVCRGILAGLLIALILTCIIDINVRTAASDLIHSFIH